MKISVIVPTYKRPGYLCIALDSVFAQSRVPDEVIVVDDGSPEETRRAIEQYPHPVRYHYQQNAGLSAARNTGMRLSTGEALLFLDDDDVLLPEALSELEAALQVHPQAALAYCRANLIDQEGSGVQELWSVGNEAERDLLWESLISVNFIRSAGCVLIRRGALPTEEPWDRGQVLEDWDVWLQLAEPPNAHFVRVDRTLFSYRVHGTNLSVDPVRLYNGGRALYLKHQARHPEGSPRRRAVDGLLAENPPLTEGQPPQKPTISLRHRLLRLLLEGCGLAPLYRRVPISWRLRLRSALGIAPWTRN